MEGKRLVGPYSWRPAPVFFFQPFPSCASIVIVSASAANPFSDFSFIFYYYYLIFYMRTGGVGTGWLCISYTSTLVWRFFQTTVSSFFYIGWFFFKYILHNTLLCWFLFRLLWSRCSQAIAYLFFWVFSGTTGRHSFFSKVHFAIICNESNFFSSPRLMFNRKTKTKKK